MKTPEQLAVIPTEPLGMTMEEHQAAAQRQMTTLRESLPLWRVALRGQLPEGASALLSGDTVGGWSELRAAVGYNPPYMLAYGDGSFVTVAEAQRYFPHSPLAIFTVFWGMFELIDCEPGNSSWYANGPNATGIHMWMVAVRKKGITQRPGVYTGASVSQALITGLARLGVSRADWRLGSAHWTGVPHICGPSVCGYPLADWTQYAGNVGGMAGYDLDAALPNCFTPAPAPTPTPPPPSPSPPPPTPPPPTPVPTPTPTPPPPPKPKFGDVMFIAKSASGPTQWFIAANTKTPIATPADLKVYEAVLTAAGLDSTTHIFSDAQLNAIPTAK